MREGDVVLALEVPHLPGRSVSIGIITKLYNGSDGVPRRADVRVRGMDYYRALRSLSPFGSCWENKKTTDKQKNDEKDSLTAELTKEGEAVQKSQVAK